MPGKSSAADLVERFRAKEITASALLHKLQLLRVCAYCAIMDPFLRGAASVLEHRPECQIGQQSARARAAAEMDEAMVSSGYVLLRRDVRLLRAVAAALRHDVRDNELADQIEAWILSRVPDPDA